MKISVLMVWLLCCSTGCFEAGSLLVDMKEAQYKIKNADARYQRGDFAGAIPLYEEGLSIRPKWGEPYKKLAISYEQTGQPDLAVKTYRRYLVEADAKDTEVLAQAGRLYENQGRNREALDMYRRLLEVSPNHPEAQANVKRLEDLLKQEQKPQ